MFVASRRKETQLTLNSWCPSTLVSSMDVRTLSTLWFLLALVLLATTAEERNPHGLHASWICPSCPQEKVGDVFGAIALSLHVDVRDMYYSLNTEWYDNMLLTGANVEVSYTAVDDIMNVNLPEDEQDKKTLSQASERYQVIFAEVPQGKSIYDSYTVQRQHKIDDFLTLHPCWIPLHEPHPMFSNKTHPLRSRFFNHAVILVKLPLYGYGMTCKLYELVVGKQFPLTCPDKLEDYRVHWASNAGYGGSLITVLEQLVYNYAETPELIFTIPFGQSADKTWLWNDKSCAKAKSKYDVWSCNFLPLSNCTQKAVQAGGAQTKYDYANPSNKEIKLFVNQNSTEFSVENRRLYHDGHETEEGTQNWMRYRLFAFIQRPNSIFRMMIKAFMGNVHELYADPSIDNQREHGYIKTSKHLKPCIGLHVRNGDVWTDGRGPLGVIIDRSLNGHLYVAKNLSVQMGITTLYLATDNVTLIDLAPKIYPEYKWFMLKRKIPVYTGKDNHVHESSSQIELGNIFADIITISRCSALVSAFDSSFTRSILFTMCNHDLAGVCPPTDTTLRSDLRVGGPLPYAGVYPPPADYNWGGNARDSGDIYKRKGGH